MAPSTAISPIASPRSGHWPTGCAANEPPSTGSLDEPAADAAAARAALRAWTGVVLSARSEHHGLVRALYALAAKDAEIRTVLRERREGYARKLVAWLRDLADRGIIALPAAESAGAVLFAMVDGIGREAIAAGEPLEESQLAAAIDLVERAVFGVVA